MAASLRGADGANWAGRLRTALNSAVLIVPGGTSTEAVIGAWRWRSCAYSISAILKIAALVIEYSGADGTGATTPTEEEVITTWPGSPCSSIAGTSALTPLITPHRLTAICQAQSLISCSHSAPGALPETPALRNATWTLP